MLTKEQLTIKAEAMQKYLEQKPGSEPNDLIERAENLSVLIAQSGQCLADAKYLQDTVVNGAIMEALQKAYEERLSPQTINKFVTTAAKDYNYLVNWFTRINASGTHQLDWLRSAISYKKAELNLI
jgi:hypothetical protein